MQLIQSVPQYILFHTRQITLHDIRSKVKKAIGQKSERKKNAGNLSDTEAIREVFTQVAVEAAKVTLIALKEATESTRKSTQSAGHWTVTEVTSSKTGGPCLKQSVYSWEAMTSTLSSNSLS